MGLVLFLVVLLMIKEILILLLNIILDVIPVVKPNDEDQNFKIEKVEAYTGGWKNYLIQNF